MNFKQVFIALLTVQVSSNEIKTLYTNGYSYSQFFPLEENLDPDKTLRFSVRTSRDAHILLAPSHQADGPVYEIVLGANNDTFSHIRGRYFAEEIPSATIRTVHLLSDKEFRNFWIRIKADDRRTFVQVGIGGNNMPFQEWRDPRPLNPQYLSFRSGTIAEWRYGHGDKGYTVGISKDKRQSIVTANGFGQYFPLSEVVSHSDDAVTLYFTVRTSKEFQILLSPGLSFLGEVYEFGIGETGAYVCRRHHGSIEAINQRDRFLDERRRLGFWIKLSTDGQVMLGKDGSAIPILHWRDPNPISPQFVSFSLYRARGEDPDASSYADLQYSLGPDYTLPSQDCGPRWKNSTGKLPPGAFRGGYNDQVEIFICRADYDGDLTPARFLPGKDGKGQCQLTWGWSIHPKSEYQALTGCRFTWVAGSYGTTPDRALVAGKTSQNKPLYVSRIAHQGQVIVGKLHPAHRITYAIFNDHERPFTSYEVLVNPTSDPPTVDSGND